MKITDKMRMDWWAKQNHGIIAPSFSGDRDWHVRFKGSIKEFGFLRDAIDHCMRKDARPK